MAKSRREKPSPMKITAYISWKEATIYVVEERLGAVAKWLKIEDPMANKWFVIGPLGKMVPLFVAMVPDGGILMDIIPDCLDIRHYENSKCKRLHPKIDRKCKRLKNGRYYERYREAFYTCESHPDKECDEIFLPVGDWSIGPDPKCNNPLRLINRWTCRVVED